MGDVKTSFLTKHDQQISTFLPPALLRQVTIEEKLKAEKAFLNFEKVRV
jgi:hypothetical protein